MSGRCLISLMSGRCLISSAALLRRASRLRWKFFFASGLKLTTQAPEINRNPSPAAVRRRPIAAPSRLGPDPPRGRSPPPDGAKRLASGISSSLRAAICLYGSRRRRGCHADRFRRVVGNSRKSPTRPEGAAKALRDMSRATGSFRGAFGDAWRRVLVQRIFSMRSRRRRGCHGERPGELLGPFRGSARARKGPRPFKSRSWNRRRSRPPLRSEVR